jgi:hypothetical protein
MKCLLQYNILLQDTRLSQARNYHETGSKQKQKFYSFLIFSCIFTQFILPNILAFFFLSFHEFCLRFSFILPKIIHSSFLSFLLIFVKTVIISGVRKLGNIYCATKLYKAKNTPRVKRHKFYQEMWIDLIIDICLTIYLNIRIDW